MIKKLMISLGLLLVPFCGEAALEKVYVLERKDGAKVVLLGDYHTSSDCLSEQNEFFSELQKKILAQKEDVHMIVEGFVHPEYSPEQVKSSMEASLKQTPKFFLDLSLLYNKKIRFIFKVSCFDVRPLRDQLNIHRVSPWAGNGDFESIQRWLTEAKMKMNSEWVNKEKILLGLDPASAEYLIKADYMKRVKTDFLRLAINLERVLNNCNNIEVKSEEGLTVAKECSKSQAAVHKTESVEEASEELVTISLPEVTDSAFDCLGCQSELNLFDLVLKTDKKITIVCAGKDHNEYLVSFITDGRLSEDDKWNIVFESDQSNPREWRAQVFDSFDRSKDVLVEKKECCTVCKKTAQDETKLSLCAKCKSALYCSRDCQLKDWKSGHKASCKAMIKRVETEVLKGASGNS
jgi:hypothetical protein